MSENRSKEKDKAYAVSLTREEIIEVLSMLEAVATTDSQRQLSKARLIVKFGERLEDIDA